MHDVLLMNRNAGVIYSRTRCAIYLLHNWASCFQRNSQKIKVLRYDAEVKVATYQPKQNLTELLLKRGIPKPMPFISLDRIL